MSESVIDFAGLDAAVAETPAVESTPVVETPAVETPAAEVDAAAPAAEGVKKETKQQYNSDGTPKEAVAEAAKAEDLPGTEKTPKEIRSALKAFRDASPANIAATKVLHGAYERWEAAKAIYPGGVNEMKQAKEFHDLLGGAEGYEKLTGIRDAAEASDAKLYDPAQGASLIEDVVEDLKSQGKLSNLGPLTSAMLDAAQANDKAGYDKAIAGHFFNELVENNFGNALQGLVNALNDPDPAKGLEEAKKIVTSSNGMKGWFDRLANENKTAKAAVISPERKQLDEERANFLKEQQTFKTTQNEQFKTSVASANEKDNNRLLGTELKSYLAKPFFKGYGKENLMPLGNAIKNNLYAALKADSAYQAQMKALWGAKNPDRAKIEEYHKARVESIAEVTVRNTVQNMYPGYANGGAAAGRVAAATDKKAAVAKVETQAAASGKPIYVAVKPKDLDRTRKDSTILEITGKGYLPNGKFVTWRR